MPIKVIPLSFAPNQRGPIITSSSAPTKDARMVRCFHSVFANPGAQNSEQFVEKIPGWAAFSTPSAGNKGTAIHFTHKGSLLLTAFGDPATANAASTIYSDTTSIGATSGAVGRFQECFISSERYVTFGSSDGTGWFLAESAPTTTAYTADGNNSTTITDIKISGANNTAGLYPGQLLTAGANIVAGSRIVSVNSTAFTAVLDTATTGGAFNDLAITKTPISKIIDADFPSLSGDLVEMDGFIFCAGIDSNAKPVIAQSAINSPSAWSADDRLTPAFATDRPVGVAKYNGMIVYFSQNSVQFFANAGNPVGSVLRQNTQASVYGVGAVGSNTFGYAPIVNAGNTVYWLGTANGVVSGVYRLNGYMPENIANDAVTRALSAVIAPIHPFVTLAFDSFNMFGKQFIYVATGDIGYLYSIEDNEWFEAGFFAGGMKIGGGWGSTANPQLYGVRMTTTGGKVYEIDKTNLTYQDDSASYTMTIQTPPQVFNNGKAFIIKSIELVADTQASGSTGIAVSGDDYATFTTARNFDNTQTRKKLFRFGRFRNHAIFKLTHSDNTAWRGQVLLVDWEPCTT